MNDKNHLLDDSFEKYRTLVIRNAHLFVKDYHMAEDICQETFIRLGENLDRIPPENIRIWLIRVSERLALDAMKKGGKYTMILGLTESKYMDSLSGSGDLSDLMVSREEKECRRNVLGELKKERPLWYETIVMCYLEEMDNPSIGRMLGVKTSLIGKWKERARKWLASRYESKYREEDT